MKKALFLFSFLGFICIGLFAQNNPVAKADSIIFKSLVHDYGTIEQGGDGTCEFSFTNTGKEPIVLSGVRASCGCTVPEWSKEPVLPGQTSVIKVKYDTRRLGAINKSIVVNSNAINSPVILKITGNIVAKQ